MSLQAIADAYTSGIGIKEICATYNLTRGEFSLIRRDYKLRRGVSTHIAPAGNVLVIGDTHLPFAVDGYLEFCLDVQRRFDCTHVVHIGDEIDNAALSYHEKDPDMPGAACEAERAMEAIRAWYAAFPDVTVLVGNHSALPFRKAKTAGLPKRLLRTYEEIWEAPPGWRWVDEYRRDGVLYVHGTGSSGQNGAIKRAIDSRCSVVMGHSHSFGGVSYHANGDSVIFGMNVGCGIDIDSMAMAYGRTFTRKPTLGCGVVLNNGQMGVFVPMPFRH